MKQKEKNASSLNEQVNQDIDLREVKSDFKQLDTKSQYYYLRKLKKTKRIIKFLQLPQSQRKALLEFRSQARDAKGQTKNDFNNDNVFEVRNLNL